MLRKHAVFCHVHIKRFLIIAICYQKLSLTCGATNSSHAQMSKQGVAAHFDFDMLRCDECKGTRDSPCRSCASWEVGSSRVPGIVDVAIALGKSIDSLVVIHDSKQATHSDSGVGVFAASSSSSSSLLDKDVSPANVSSVDHVETDAHGSSATAGDAMLLKAAEHAYDGFFKHAYKQPGPGLGSPYYVDLEAQCGVERPNHGLANALRKAALVRPVAEALAAHGGVKLSSAALDAMQVAMVFEACARKSEIGFNDDSKVYLQ